MRILKLVLIILGALIGIFLLVNLFLPSKVEVSRSINIKGSKQAAFDQVIDFRNWETWSPWLAQDSTMAFKYTERTKGEGAAYSWTTKKPEGGGSQRITRVVGIDSIFTHMVFEEQGEADGTWAFTQINENRTEVTWGFTAEFPFFFRIMGLMVEGQVANDFETGLANIKYLVESQKIKTVESPITMVEKDSISFFSITQNVDMAEFAENGSEYFTKNYTKIVNYLGKEMQKVKDAPFAIFHEWNEETRSTTIEFCIPILTDLEEKEDIQKRVLSKSKGLEVDYYGPYELTGKAHKMIEDYALENKVDLAGIGLEFYVTDPSEEPDTSKWLTKIYYPSL